MFTAWLAMMTFLIAGCPTTENLSECPVDACVPNGKCVVVGGSAQCACDDGFKQNALALICESDGGAAKLGEECVDSAVCETGWCLKYSGEETGYCSLRDCQGNDACNNFGDDGAEMCCTDVGGEYFICMKIVPGYMCGTQDGMCGSSCAGQLDSACDPAQACLMAGTEDPNAVCAHECNTNDDCSDCANPEAPELDFTCQPRSGGATYCLGEDDGFCESSMDCEGDDVCIAWPTADEMGLEGLCGKLGDLPTGAECNEDDNPNDLDASDRCADFYCMNSHCSEVCALEADCPENMVCANIRFGGMGPDGEDTADIGMCLWFSGSLADCDGNDNCPAAEICDYYLPPNGSVEKLCSDWRCDPIDADCAGPGDECGEGMAPCFTGLCLTNGVDSWCSTLCEAHSDCDTGMICGGLGVIDSQSTGACSPFDGSGDVCAGDDSCPAGEACTYISSPAGGVESLCATETCDPAGPNCAGIGEECGQGMAPCYNDLCLTNGVDTFCGAVCETHGNCPTGFLCGGLGFQGDPNTYGTCDEAPGSGDPCSGDADCATQGEVCNYIAAPNQPAESICLEWDCDPAEANCGDIGDDCGEGGDPCYNGLCLSSQGDPQGWCSATCETHADCPAGWLCGGLTFAGDPTVLGACIEASGSASPCAAEADCIDPNETCQFASPPNLPVETICLDGVVDGAGPGEVCDPDNSVFCFNDLCLTAGYCSAVCATTADCVIYTVDSVPMECTYIDLGDTNYGTACVEPDATSPLCSICDVDVDCTGDAMCISSTANPGEKYCALDCPIGDECPDGSTCTDVGGAVDQCIPDTDTCIP
jgi:hypothetical protein